MSATEKLHKRATALKILKSLSVVQKKTRIVSQKANATMIHYKMVAAFST